jgi:hypothetical protein
MPTERFGAAVVTDQFDAKLHVPEATPLQGGTMVWVRGGECVESGSAEPAGRYEGPVILGASSEEPREQEVTYATMDGCVPPDLA